MLKKVRPFKSMRNFLISCVLTCSLFCTAQAVTKSYEMGNESSVVANGADESGLIINTAIDPNLAGYDFTLNDGQTATFNFFKIWTNESAVNKDDKVAKAITAYLDFAIPDVSASLSGSSVGISIGIFGLIQYGQVTWDGPVVITSADRTFSIKLDNATFNEGVFGLDEGRCDGALIHAHVTQVQSRIPDASATLMLLGLGLLAIAGLRRR